MSELKPLTEAETTELLDWVSACQASYHIDSTPGHRFGGLGINLQENRESLVEYVNELIAARAQPAQAGQVLTDEEIDAAYEKARADYQRSRFAVRGQQLTAQDSPDWWFARAIEQAVLAKRVPMKTQRVTYTCPACHFSLERQE